MDATKSIFISYRREAGSGYAKLIKKHLENAGYGVFLDVDDMKSGHYEEELVRRIDEATDFILICTKDVLERCREEGDCVRAEVLHALKTGKNIIPVTFQGFFMPPGLPEEFGELSRFQQIFYVHEHADACLTRISNILKSKKRKGYVLKKTALFLLSVVVLIFAGTLLVKNLDRKAETPVEENFSTKSETEVVPAGENALPPPTVVAAPKKIAEAEPASSETKGAAPEPVPASDAEEPAAENPSEPASENATPTEENETPAAEGGEEADEAPSENQAKSDESDTEPDDTASVSAAVPDVKSLIEAIGEGDLEKVKKLVEAGADVNAEFSLGEGESVTPLGAAELFEQSEIAEFLRSCGAAGIIAE